MNIEDTTKKDLIARLRRIEGQARGIQRMIEEERDCQQILTQLRAMRSATQQVSLQLTRAYATECLVQATDAEGNPTDVDKLVTLISEAVI